MMFIRLMTEGADLIPEYLKLFSMFTELNHCILLSADAELFMQYIVFIVLPFFFSPLESINFLILTSK